MLPAHDLPRVHSLSCLSLSQREAIPSPGQVRRLLGKSHGRGNLPGLHSIRPVTEIRHVRLWYLLDLSNSAFRLSGISRRRGVLHSLIPAPLRPETLIANL